jgi:hypothetical protein
MMGNQPARDRRAAGRVHASVAELDAPPHRRHSAPPPGEDNNTTAPQQASGAVGEQPLHNHQRTDTTVNAAPLPLSSVLPPHDSTPTTLAAIRAEVEAERSVAQVERAAVQAQLREQAAATQRMLDEQADTKRQFNEMIAALQALRSDRTATHSAPPISSPPHRRAVLDRSTATAIPPSANAFASLDNDEFGDSDDEVTPHSHTPLPSAFRPTPAGTAQSAQQQLAAIVNGLSKQGSKVKYSSIAELNEALDDWATSRVAAGWTVQQIESIRAYQRLLVHRLPMSGKPLKVILEYHRKWCKAVDSGAIDMFAPKAAFDKDILYDVENPEQFGSTAATSTARTGKPDKARKPASSAGSEAKPATAKHPVGSCTNHPTSTTHTTAECRLK